MRFLRGMLSALVAVSVGAAIAQPFDPALFGGLRWRPIGPFRGGRALAVAGVPGQPEKFYFGAVGGGVWETENAGRTWNPIFDQVPVASIGAIAIAPSDPSVIYVGTGEADMRGDIQQGDGIYKSTDAGKTWAHIGLEDTRQIGRILVDPKDSNIVYVAALGHQFGPNAERGVFKTTDGGANWSKVLFRNPDVGAIDLAMDPGDSHTIFAAMWQTRRPPWSVYPPSNGPGSGLFKSTDAGASWQQVQGHGFPSFTGRIGITISPAIRSRIFALVDTNDAKTGGVYRSDDGGATWSLADGDGRLWNRGWYFAGITADPKNADALYVMNTSTYKSVNAGKSFTAIKGAPGGDDYHALWVEPDDPGRMILGSDQGVVISVDGAKTWSSWYNQPTGQFYHVVADNRFPYWVYGAQQDSGAMAVPSRTIHTGIGALDARPIDAGGESGTIAPDPLHPGLLYSSTGSKELLDTAWEQTIDPTLSHMDTVWRSTWTTPIIVSPADPRVVYTSHQQVFRSADGGSSWKIISPDLTRKENVVPGTLDAVTAADDIGLPHNGVVFWIAPSPIKPHEIWAGTDDGLIWITRDEGAHWQDVTPPKLTPWSKVGVIDASHFDPDTAYAAIDRHQLDDNAPYIYRTHDGGIHWTPITRGIPGNQFVNVVREDPVRRGLLYAGTDWGVYVSFNDGDDWQPLQLNLPAASVRDIVFQNGDVIVGTHGRAIWVLDDAMPLRQISAQMASAKAVLLTPSPAMLFQRAGTFGFGQFNEGSPLPAEEPQGENPAWGATIDYVLNAATSTVEFTFLDETGHVMRRLSSADKLPEFNAASMDIPEYWFHPGPGISTASGAHRLVWDLRFQNAAGPLVPPGAYVVQMRAGGHTFSQPLTVVRDPRVAATVADLRAQFAFEQEVAAEIVKAQRVQTKAQKLLADRGPKMSASDRAALQELIGSQPPGTPDEGGATPTDVNSLRAIIGGLGAVAGAASSAPAAPTAEYRTALANLRRKLHAAEVELQRLAPPR